MASTSVDPLALAHLDRGGAGGQGGDAIHQEPVFGEHHLIARPGIGLRQKLDDLVAADAADDAGGVEAMHLGDGRAQIGMVGRRIAVQRVNGAQKASFALSDGPKGFSFDDSLIALASPAAAALPPT